MTSKNTKATMPVRNKVPRAPKVQTSHSDYWLESNIDTMDISKLASVQRAVANFTRILAKKAVPTTYSTGRDSYTDGRTVVLSAPKSLKEIDSTVGLALHEASHIIYTDFESTRSYIDTVIKHFRTPEVFNVRFAGRPWATKFLNSNNLKNLTNVLEDRRIDRLVCEAAPGYQGYYKALYDRYFNDRVINEALLNRQCVEPTYDNYEFQIVNLTNEYFDASVMPGLKEIVDLIDLPNITRLSDTTSVIDVAMSVLCTVIDNMDSPEAQPKSDPTPEPAASNTPNQEIDEDNLDLPRGSSSQDETEDSEESDESNGADVEDSEESDESNGADVEDSEESDETDGADVEDTEESDEDDESKNSSSEGAADSGTAPSTNTDNAQDSDLDTATAEDAAAKAKEDAANKKLKEKLDRAKQQQQDFLNGEVRKNKVSAADARILGHMYAGTIQEVAVEFKDETDGRMCTENVVILKGIAAADGLPGVQHIAKNRMARNENMKYIIQGIQVGHQLANRLKTRTEIHSLTTTRQATGRVDKRLLAELGFNNDHVFTQTKFETTRPAHIHISIDASGSMYGGKFYSALKTAVAVAKAASMIDEVTCMISLRGSHVLGTGRRTRSRVRDQRPCMFIVYDSTIDRLNAAMLEKLSWLSPGGGTPEALCYAAASSIIEKSSANRDSFLINVSDGAPYWSYDYNVTNAVAHCKQVVDKFRNANIQVLSYFVYDADTEKVRNEPYFKRMYGTTASFIDRESLTQLSSSINRLLEYQQK